MLEMSYGLNTPADILEKLRYEAKKIDETPHPYEIFNFIVTAAVLNEWITRNYVENEVVLAMNQARSKQNFELIPDVASSWITDRACLPNQHCDTRRHITNALGLCWDTANASKHFHWFSTTGVRAIAEEPIVGDWYQYFFTSCEPDLYIDYGGECYGLRQIRGILLQFYTGLGGHLKFDSFDTSTNKA